MCVCNSNEGIAGRVLEMAVPDANCVLPLQPSFLGTSHLSSSRLESMVM